MTDIEFKTGDSDDVGVQLLENGLPINLTGFSVSYVIKSSAGVKTTIACTLGSVYQGNSYSAAEGGVTINFSSTDTLTAGQYRGEFVISLGSILVHIPSGNNYNTLTIWDAL